MNAYENNFNLEITVYLYSVHSVVLPGSNCS